MIDWLETVEDKLVRVETWALVVCVVVMLVLAGYNVLYRNALIPLQTHLRTSGPVAASEDGEPRPEDGERTTENGDRDDEAGGFGGGFGGGASEAGGRKTEDGKEDDETDGFQGGFGDGSDADGQNGEDGTEGFGGGFGGGEGADTKTDGETETGEPAADGEARVTSRESRSRGGPPPEGSLAAWLVDAIDAIKLPWIDIFLRQLVLIVGFLGAMLAARRREHITVDAVGQIVTGRTREVVDTGTSIFAALICVVLAASGWNLVELGMQFPRELMPWAKQWHFQFMFPVGFGMTGLHFTLRAVESGRRAFSDDGGEKRDEGGEQGAENGEGPPEDGDQAPDPSDETGGEP